MQKVKTSELQAEQSSEIRSEARYQSYWLDQPKHIKLNEQARNSDNSFLFQWMLAELSAYKGDVNAGLEDLHVLAQELNQAEAYKRVANIAIFAKNEVLAYDAISRWLKLEPDSEHARRLALRFDIQNLQNEKSKKKALVHIDWLYKNSELNELQVFKELAPLIARQKDKQVAIQFMEELVNIYGDKAYIYVTQASLAVIFGHLDFADTSLNKALSIQPNFTDALVLQSQLMRRMGKSEEALQQLKAAVLKDKNNVVLRKAYARMLLDNKDYKKAKYQYEYMLEDKPNDEAMLFTLGALNLDAKDYSEAKDYFKRLQKVTDRGDEANFYLGRIAVLEENYQEAVSHYLSIYGGNYFTESRFRAAWAYANIEKYEASYQLFEHLRENTDRAISLRSYLAHAQLLRQEKQYQTSLALYDEALSIEKNNIDLLYGRSLVHEKLKRFDLVEKDLMAILQQEPDNVDALNALGYSMLNMTTRYDDAFVLIKRAMQLEPENGAIIDSFGWALYKKGQYRKALRYLRKAYAQFADAEVAAHLGEVLWVLGEKQEAEIVWANALKKSPDSDIVISTINRLKNL